MTMLPGQPTLLLLLGILTPRAAFASGEEPAATYSGAEIQHRIAEIDNQVHSFHIICRTVPGAVEGSPAQHQIELAA